MVGGARVHIAGLGGARVHFALQWWVELGFTLQYSTVRMNFELVLNMCNMLLMTIISHCRKQLQRGVAGPKK